jgi:hypothetical protein
MRESRSKHSRDWVFALMMVVFVATVPGCINDAVNYPFPDTSTEYFPLVVGSRITYQVDSIVFDDAQGGNKKDTVSFQLKEEIHSMQISHTGDTMFYLHRYRRADESDLWILTDVWTASRTSTEGLRTEENLTFLKLNFPLRFGKRWLTTSYIHPNTTVRIGTENVRAYQDWEAEVLSYDRADTIGGFSFADGEVMKLTLTDADDGVMKRYVHETYVRHLGLVARIDTILDSRCIELGDFGPCLGKPWTEHAGKGYILSQTMIDYE